MKTLKKSLFLLSTVVAVASCSTQPAEKANSSLIVYYSSTGTTEKVANILHAKTGADLVRIECEQPYSTDFMQCIGEFQQEMQGGTTRAIKPLGVDLTGIDTLYLGFPVWFGTYGGPINTFLKENDLTGKTLIPFCTFGSGGNTAIDNLAKAVPTANIQPWYGVRAARIDKAEAEVESFLVGLGIVAGEKQTLPEFSEQQPVDEATTAIFDAACSSYQMPLGTPSTVGSRKLANATEYCFVVKATNMEGQESQQQILVTVGDAEGSVAEFTQVIR